MKTATLTFHGSHNYGSMLQAYALQRTMTRLFGHNEIVNFRSPKQKRMMRVITLRPRLGPIMKDFTHLFYYKQLKIKHQLFERFLNDELILSPGELSAVSAHDLDGYDLVCAGSDQIWNPNPGDFTFAYLLPYKLHAKKISYAASMGPGNAEFSERIAQFPNLLKDFDAISVREEGSRQVIKRLSDRDDIMVHCDPVFLLDKQQWNQLIAPEPIIKDKYIFLYTLFASPLIINCAKALSRKHGIPVIISNFTNIHDLFSPFKKKLKSGPKEFLNLLSNAELVVTSSFHGTAFSVLLNKPFVTINGAMDNRINNLLKLTGLTSRSVSAPDEITKIDWAIDFTQANRAIAGEREKSFAYLSLF